MTRQPGRHLRIQTCTRSTIGSRVRRQRLLAYTSILRQVIRIRFYQLRDSIHQRRPCLQPLIHQQPHRHQCRVNRGRSHRLHAINGSLGQ
jgi:hypothetical protein